LLFFRPILERSWDEKEQYIGGTFVSSDGVAGPLDASVLLIGSLGFIDPMDERFIKTVHV